ncbi:MAG: hypothetical protein P8X83_03135, partial [Nitrosopumilaceae archaeon]
DTIILSSFGERGARYFTTNCENCPFGTTKAACRKESLSYIIDYFKKCFGVDLTSPDFDGIEENQALLKIKRIVSMAKKEKNTKLERSISSGLSELFGTAVDKSLQIKSKNAKTPGDVSLKTDDQLFKLPILFHLGLYKGAQSVDEHPKKFLRYARVEEF